MSLEKIKKFILKDVAVTLNGDKTLFKDTIDKINAIINDDSSTEKENKFERIKDDIKTLLDVCKRNPKDASLKRQYTNLKSEISKKFQKNILDIGPLDNPDYTALESNWNKIIEEFNYIIDVPKSFSYLVSNFSWEDNEQKDIINLSNKIKTAKQELNNETLTWQKRIETSGRLLAEVEELRKKAEEVRVNLETEAGKKAIGEIKKKPVVFLKYDEKAEPTNKETLTQIKPLIKKFDNNSVKYRKWWVMKEIIKCDDDNIPKKLLLKGVKFDCNNPLPDDVIKAISLMDVKSLNSCIYALNEDSTWVIGSIKEHLLEPEQSLGAKLLLYYVGGFENIEKDTGLKLAIKSLAQDIEKALDFNKELIGSDIKKIKPDSNLIENVLSVLKRCEIQDQKEKSNEKKEPAKQLKEALMHYVDGGEGVSSKNMNALLRNTLHVLERKGLYQYFEPEVYKKLCEHVKTLTEAFKEDSKEKTLITKTKNNITVYRGMDYIGLYEMFKNGNYKLPDKQEDFNEETAKAINEKLPIIFDNAPLSTSESKDVALDFAGGSSDYRVFLEISVPIGTKSVNISKDLSEARNGKLEKEILLPPKAKLKLEKCVFKEEAPSAAKPGIKYYWITIKAKIEGKFTINNFLKILFKRK